jgi:catalase
VRGPTLLEDFILREKITHFDHERIPERAVHARGSAAHGYFQVYKSMSQFTCADFLQDPDAKTPVFVRFSTVAGSRRLCRHRARRARLCRQVLHARGQLRPRGQQHFRCSSSRTR